MALTEVRAFRPGSVVREYNALTYAEAVAGFPTLQPGDIVSINSSGLKYLVTAEEGLSLLGSLKSARVARLASFNTIESEAIADTDTSLVRTIDNLRIHGQGLAETDAGAVWADGAGGIVATLTTTDEADHLTALSFGGDTEAYAPATFGPMTVEAVVNMTSAITDRSLFVGFIGTATAALDPVVTGSGTTITLVQDDLVGLYYDSDLTDADRLYFPSNKANGAASIATTAAGVDTNTDMAAAGTDIRLRVTVDAAGNATAYVNGNKVATRGLACTAATALNPIVYVEANAAAVKTMVVKEFWFASEA